MSELLDTSEWKQDSHKNSMYYLGGKLKEPDPHEVARIKNLPLQRERTRTALKYSLENAGIYTNPTLASKERDRISEELKNLPKEGDEKAKVTVETQKKVGELKARSCGLSAIILLNRGVEADISGAEAYYYNHYFDKSGGAKPTLDLDKITELYDKTDKMSDESPMILTIRAMHGLDIDTLVETERIGRILLLEESQEINNAI